MGDSAEKEQPSVKLSFGQIISLGLFILGLIGGSVKLLYDAIDERLDKIEDKIDKHEERIGEVQEKVSVQEVKLEHLMHLKSLQKDKPPLIADAGGDDDGEGSEEVETPWAVRRVRRSSGRSEAWTPRSDMHSQCEESTDCPRHYACHDGRCWPPGGGEGGGPPSADGGGPPAEPDEPPPPVKMAASEHYDDDTFDGATSMVVEADDGETRHEQRRRERCEKRWRRGCPPPPVNLASQLRQASDDLALMQLREASDRLAKLQRRERRA